MSVRNSEIYVSSYVRRGLDAAALLKRLDSGDALAELWLREELGKIPEVEALQQNIQKAVDKERKAFEERIANERPASDQLPASDAPASGTATSK